MSHTNVTCPHCDVQLRTGERPGTKVTCSACGEMFDVREDATFEDIEVETGRGRRRRYEKKSGTHPVILLAAWALIGLFILGLVAGGVWWKHHAELEALDQERLDQAWRDADLATELVSLELQRNAFAKIDIIRARHPTWPPHGPNPAKKH